MREKYDKSKPVYIYAVTEYGSKDVIYVGYTRNPNLEQRLFFHLNNPVSPLREYKMTDKPLSIYLIESVDYDDGFPTERKWIKFYLDNGAKLLNRAHNPNYKIKA